MKYIAKHQLRIKLADGGIRNVAVRPGYTVVRVLNEAGVKGKLRFRGKTLPDDATLESLGIGEGETVELRV